MGLFDNYTGDVLERAAEPQWRIPVAFAPPPPAWTVQACPVCQGRGCVSSGFYVMDNGPVSTSGPMAPEQCRACKGKGLLRVSMLGLVEPIP